MKQKSNKRRKGFTLIELIVVIAILAILAAVAVPQFFSLIEKANTATEVAAAAEYANAINVFNALNSTNMIYNVDVGDLTETIVDRLGNLKPVFDSEVKLPDVLARIEVDDKGVAIVKDRS